MPENVYLKNLRTQYEGLRSSIEGFQARAAEANRDLSDDELRSVREQGAKAKDLFTQIEDLTEIETRNAKVAEMAAKVATATAPGATSATGDQVRALGITTKDRDPGHYTRSSANSFFKDLHSARVNDDNGAQQRLLEHSRALTTGSNGPGVVPPHWLTEEFEALARQGRALASAVRNVPLGDDPRPMTLPKQTVGTDAVVAEQASENTAVAGTDAWDSDVDTVTPKPTAGKQIVSRQMLDMASPAIDQLIYADLMSVYNAQVETKVGTAIKAAGVALAVPMATESAFDTAAADAVVDLAMGVRKARKLPANILAMTLERYAEFLKLKGTDGRPLIGEDTAGQTMNVVGVGNVAVDGRIRGLGVIATEGMGSGAYPDIFAAVRASDVLLFETGTMRFRFEEVSGPESIVLGIWGYTAVIVRQGTRSVRRTSVAAA